jgi:hypothetical protein
MELKSKISFVIPDAMRREYREQIVKDGYDLKGKSKWIAESIHHLLSMGNYPELVYISNEMKGFEKMETVSIPKPLKLLIDQAIIEIRKCYPAMEGVQSGILRTAIVQRLLQSR